MMPMFTRTHPDYADVKLNSSEGADPSLSKGVDPMSSDSVDTMSSEGVDMISFEGVDTMLTKATAKLLSMLVPNVSCRRIVWLQ